MSSRARSRPEGFDLAVVALSARALAASAKRAGLSALAIDLFADDDTRDHAALAVRSPASRRGLGFSPRQLLRSIEAHAPAGLSVVLGAGFEHAPDLMRAIGERNPIIGATAETVARLKDPITFATLLSVLDIPHPHVLTNAAGAAVHLSPPGRGDRGLRNEEPPHPLGFSDRPLPGGERWKAPAPARRADRFLSKRIGASGGAHIRVGVGPARGRYLQERVEGRPVSALFLADGRTARIVGVSEQWTDPTPRAPFRYGGAFGPVALPDALGVILRQALDRIVAATGLVGLASADLVLPTGSDGPPFRLLEINPRPGATLDVFDAGETPPLLGLHLDACAGRLPGALPVPTEARAAAVVYAQRAVSPAALRRPLWTADWPSCDETVPAGAPFCTISAAASSPDAARALLMDRRAALDASLRAAASPALTNAMVPA